MRFKVPKGLTEVELKEKIADGSLFVKWGVLHYYKDKDDEGIEIHPHYDESEECEPWKRPSEELEIAPKEEWEIEAEEDEEENETEKALNALWYECKERKAEFLNKDKEEEEEEAECESCGSHTDVKPHLYGSLSMAVCPKCA